MLAQEVAAVTYRIADEALERGRVGLLGPLAANVAHGLDQIGDVLPIGVHVVDHDDVGQDGVLGHQLLGHVQWDGGELPPVGVLTELAHGPVLGGRHIR